VQRQPLTVRAAVSAIVLIASAAGIADALCLYGDLYASREGKAYVPWSIWPVDILLVTVWCLIVASPFLIRSMRRWSAVVALYAGPALLFYHRAFPAKIAYWPNAGSRRFAVAVVALFLPIATAVVYLMDREPVRRFLRRAFVPVVVVLGGAVFLIAFSRWSPEPRRSIASPAGRRNVVLIFLDAVRAESLSADDMPNLMRFSERGTRYTFAFAPSSWTLPSHLSVVTGVPSPQLPVDAVYQSIDDRFVTLAERFHRDGYRTAAVLANWFPNHGTGMQRGYDLLQYPLARLDLDRTGLVRITRAVFRYPDLWMWWDADDVNARVRSFIRGGGPYFVTVNYLDAHAPFYQTRRCSRRHPQSASPVIAYRDAVWCMDESIGRLLHELEPDIDAGRTVVAIVADHGEQFGEHGLWKHGNSLYAQLLHVPLVVRGSGFPAAVKDGPVCASGLYAALLAASGGSSESAAAALERAPVIAYLRGGTDGWWSVVDRSYQLIARADGRMELYDLAVDPEETQNLWSDPRLTAVRNDLAERIAAVRATTLPPRAIESPFKGLGYLP
jgi:arylsulfatase A-like enzyme